MFKPRTLIIIGVIVVIVLIIYYAFPRGATSSNTLLTTTNSTSPSPVTEQLLASLSNLQSVTLNNAIFSNPVFQSLTDFGVVIPPENVGRRNPFQSFGTVVSAPSQPSSSGH